MASPLSAHKYRYDPTGSDPANKLIDIEKTVVTGDPHIIVLDQGLFYSDTVTVLDGATPMTLGTDYDFVSIDPFVTANTGKSAASAIRIKDNAWVGTVKITCQIVGGAEGQDNQLVQDLIDALGSVGSSGVSWTAIVGKPAAYPPALHRHDPTDLNDLDLLSQRLDDVTNALINKIPLNESPHHFQEQIDRILRLLAQQANRINDIVANNGGALLLNLQQRIEEIEQVADYQSTAFNGALELLGSWDTSQVKGVRGIIMYTDGTDTHMEDVMFVTDTTNILLTRYGKLTTAADMFTIDGLIVGGNMQINITPNIDGDVKVKWLSIF